MSTESVSAPVALVTGADKGTGLETARRLAGPGTGCISPPAAANADGAADAQFLELDMTSDESVRHAAGWVEEARGHLDVLVNNAGITGPMRDAHDHTADDMTEAVALFTRSQGGFSCKRSRSADHQDRRRRSL